MRGLRYFGGSLKIRLALAGLVLIAASVALTVVLVLRAMEQRSQRAALDSEVANAERIGLVLSAKIVSLQNSLRAATTQLDVAQLTDPDAVKRWLDAQRVLSSLFDGVFLADGRLHVIGFAENGAVHGTDIDASDRDYLRRTVRERRSVVSRVGVSRTSGTPMFAITMPLFDADGHVGAVLIGGMKLSSSTLLGDLTRPAMDDHSPVATVIADADGNVVSSADPARVMTRLEADPHFAGAIAQWRAEGAPIEPQGSARHLGNDIVAMAGVPAADWVVLRSAPAEVLLGGPTAGRRQAIWIGAAVAVAGGLIILLVMLALLRPLRQLEKRALRLIGEDFSAQEPWPQAGGELGELTRVFQYVLRQKADWHKASDELLGKMRAVMGTAPVGIAFTRMGRFELVSDEFARLFGYDSAGVHGMQSHVICPSDEAHGEFMRMAIEAFAAGGTCDAERELVRADSSRFWARLQGAPVSAGDASAGTIWIFTDITESRRHREQLSWSASHDELTGLVNRREFELRLAEEIGERADAEPAAALFIDLDRFKAVNDSSGHAAGDVLLKDIAAILLTRARAHDTVARIGGDEFAVLLRGCDPRAAERIAAGICARVAEHALVWSSGGQSQLLSVGASIGIVAIDAAFDSVKQVLEAADEACYDAKRAGRGTVRMFRRAAGATPLAVD
ncbi:MAG: diguanylate cyclase [Burkholderiales bacterium]|nr:diguanylate cyclase [Burkholderiales bacterium]